MATTLKLTSPLRVDDAAAWAHATSLAGIVRELPGPLRLTTRPLVTTLAELREAGTVLATLRLGPVPVLRWHPGIVELGERHFVEGSSDMSFMRSWRHERTIPALPEGGCRISDTVTFEPRLRGTGWLVGWLFRRRHAALRRLLG